MSSSQGALATVARESPVPAQAQQIVQGFLELYEGVPASKRVMQELCDATVQQTTPFAAPMAAKNLNATTRVVLEWTTLWNRSRNGMVSKTLVSVSVQEWR